MTRTEEISLNLGLVKERIAAVCTESARDPSSVRLIAVTKTYPLSDMMTVLECGCHDVGENRVQELEEKIPLLNIPVSAHLIGHLQSNKVNKVVPLVSWIHSVDSIRLLEKIDAACGMLGKRMNILVQVNTSNEESKSGCEPEDCAAICGAAAGLAHVDLRGLMAIGPLNGTFDDNRASFRLLRKLADENRASFREGSYELSMGMSGDFEQAIAEGATMVRVGSLIFGKRTYL